MSETATESSGAQSTSSVTAEQELAQLKQRQTWQKYIAGATKPGWDAVKVNFLSGIFLTLVFALFTLFLVFDINHNKVEYGMVLFMFVLFGFITHNLSQIKHKLAYFFYSDDDARISDSIYDAEVFTSVWSRDQILDKVKEQDINRIQSSSNLSVMCSGLILASFFAELERIKDIWIVGLDNASRADIVHTITGSAFFLPVLFLTIWGSFKGGSDFMKLTKSLRVLK